MKRIYDWDARFSLRNFTAADLRSFKGKRKLTQTTGNSFEEAAAAADAGIDLIMGNAQYTKEVRTGAPNLFFTAAIALPDFPTETDVLNAAFKAMKDGADSVYTARGPHIVELLAKEQIPVMCHLGLVPRRSGWHGGLRAIGRTADEAFDLWKAFRRMEDAGAFSVEAEVIPAPVMEAISRRTSLVTMSLGSGSGGDVIYGSEGNEGCVCFGGKRATAAIPVCETYGEDEENAKANVGFGGNGAGIGGRLGRRWRRRRRGRTGLKGNAA